MNQLVPGGGKLRGANCRGSNREFPPKMVGQLGMWSIWSKKKETATRGMTIIVLAWVSTAKWVFQQQTTGHLSSTEFSRARPIKPRNMEGFAPKLEKIHGSHGGKWPNSEWEVWHGVLMIFHDGPCKLGRSKNHCGLKLRSQRTQDHLGPFLVPRIPFPCRLALDLDSPSWVYGWVNHL